MDLTPEQEAEARRLFEVLKTNTESDLLAIARLLVGKPDGEYFGRTEFDLRERVHRLGAAALEGGLAERKKKVISAAASCARHVTARRNSSATNPARS